MLNYHKLLEVLWQQSILHMNFKQALIKNKIESNDKNNTNKKVYFDLYCVYFERIR